MLYFDQLLIEIYNNYVIYTKQELDYLNDL